MIRPLTIADNDMIHQYLEVKPMYSLFFTADIADYGFGSSFFKLYGSFENSQLNCIFARFYQVLLVYSNSDIIPVKDILSYLKSENIDFRIIRGQSELVSQFTPYMEFSTMHKTYLCKLFRDKFKPVAYNGINIIKAGRQNIEEIIGLCNCIDEFKGLMDDDTVKKIVDYGYTYLIYEDNQLVSLAMCSAKNNSIANVGTVATHPSYRGKGYASKLLSYLCNELLKVSESCSLCYDNPEAGKLYNNLGFEEIGFLYLYII